MTVSLAKKMFSKNASFFSVKVDLNYLLFFFRDLTIPSRFVKNMFKKNKNIKLRLNEKSSYYPFMFQKIYSKVETKNEIYFFNDYKIYYAEHIKNSNIDYIF